MIEKNVTRWPA